MQTKVCTKCNEEKDLDLFGFTNKAKGYRQAQCNPCRRDYAAKKYKEQRDIEKLAIRGPQPSDDHKWCKYGSHWVEKANFHSSKGAAKDGLASRCSPCVRKGRQDRRQGIYDRLLKEQGGKCKTCPNTEADTYNGKLCIDHDHNCCPSGKYCDDCIRGLLCTGCNFAIGFAGDDIGTLENLIEYLKDWQSKSSSFPV